MPSLTVSTVTFDGFLPVAERLLPGDLVTRVGDEVFDEPMTVLDVTVVFGSALLALSGDRRMMVAASAPVDLLPAF